MSISYDYRRVFLALFLLFFLPETIVLANKIVTVGKPSNEQSSVNTRVFNKDVNHECPEIPNVKSNGDIESASDRVNNTEAKQKRIEPFFKRGKNLMWIKVGLHLVFLITFFSVFEVKLRSKIKRPHRITPSVEPPAPQKQVSEISKNNRSADKPQSIEQKNLHSITRDSQVQEEKKGSINQKEPESSVEPSLAKTAFPNVLFATAVDENGVFYEVVDEDNDEMIFKLIINGDRAKFEVLRRAFDKVCKAPDFLVGACVVQKISQNPNVNVKKQGHALKQGDGTWKVIEKSNVILG